MNRVEKGINVILSIDSKPVGGQLGASLNRSAESIDITNKIDGEWASYLEGVKTWSIDCSGLYVIDDECLKLLEQAFYNNTEILAQITIGNNKYEGKSIIVDFPLEAVYDDSFKYSIRLLGIGELTNENSKN